MADTRKLSSCEHIFSRMNQCQLCGSYGEYHNVLKTTLYCTPIIFSHHKYILSMRKRACKVVSPKNICETTHILLSSICQKFSFTSETHALALYIYQSLQKMHVNEKFWASCCLMVAGKGIQLDKNVPYLNRFQRYAQKSFPQIDYQQAERSIFQAMNFDIQYTTFITFIHYYLTCGVVFSDDSINGSLIQFFEDDILTRANQYLKKGIFTHYEPEKLALNIIQEIRAKYSLKKWPSKLEELSGFKEQEIAIQDEQFSVLQEKGRNYKLSDLKNISVRKKLDNLLSIEKSPPLNLAAMKHTSTTSKQNSVSTTRTLVSNRSKASMHNIGNHYSSISLTSTDLFNRRI